MENKTDSNLGQWWPWPGIWERWFMALSEQHLSPMDPGLSGNICHAFCSHSQVKEWRTSLGGLWLQNDFCKWAHCTSQCHDLLKWIYIKCLGRNPERTLSPSDVTKKSLSLSMSQVMWSTGPRFPWPFLVLALKLPHPRKPCSPEQTQTVGQTHLQAGTGMFNYAKVWAKLRWKWRNKLCILYFLPCPRREF